ncbi:MAG: hypothetical protein QW762_03025 [Candidatus Thermoplasmatota archaeon]
MKRKIWSILVVLGILATSGIQIKGENLENSETGDQSVDIATPLAIPKPTQKGDLIFAECVGFYDIPNAADHVSIWDNDNQKIIEADPYYNVWSEYRAPWPLI